MPPASPGAPAFNQPRSPPTKETERRKRSSEWRSRRRLGLVLERPKDHAGFPTLAFTVDRARRILGPRLQDGLERIGGAVMVGFGLNLPAKHADAPCIQLGVTAGAVALSCVLRPKRSAIKERRMRVFLAGATGAIGKQLVPRLAAAGHEVHGTTRNESKQAMLHELGAVPVVVDALDADQVAEAVGRVKPDVIVHQLTAIGALDPRHFDRDFAPTNHLRTVGTDHLLSAAQAVGVRRFVAQSNGAFVYGRTGEALKSEEDPLDPSPLHEMRETVAALLHLEAAVLGAGWTEGIVLRYGALYGPGTEMAPGSEQFELIRKRKFPLVGDSGGVWSFLHVADAAEATVAAVERGGRDVYNVVDDDPAPVAEWLPALAQTLGAKKPRRVPRFVGRLFVGEVGVAMMTELRGASNAKAKRELGWLPAYSSWRQGFAAA
jgi:nucleoside-diphosphate-sugar epimerase